MLKNIQENLTYNYDVVLISFNKSKTNCNVCNKTLKHQDNKTLKKVFLSLIYRYMFSLSAIDE